MPSVNESLQILVAIVFLCASAIGVIVWLLRLEGMVKYVERLANEAQKDVDVLRTKHEGLDTKIVEQLGAVRESLARLEGRLGIKYEEGE